MTRAVLFGNCHAQYFAAALDRLTDVEVRVVGTPYGGVGFRGHGATFIPRDEVPAWLRAGKGEKVVLYQTTPDTKPGRLAAHYGEFTFLRFPFVKFDAPFLAPDPEAGLAFGSDAYEDKLAIARRIDRLFNEVGFVKADWDVERLAEVEALVRTRPVLLKNNHFTGEGMAAIARLMNDHGLKDAIGERAARAFAAGVETDYGITVHVQDFPDPLSPAHGFAWWPMPSLKPLLDRAAADPAALARDLRRGLSRRLSEREAHALWTAAMERYEAQGRFADLRVAVELYRPRRHARWALAIGKALRRKGRRFAAAMLVFHRLTIADQREQFVQLGVGLVAKRRARRPANAVAV